MSKPKAFTFGPGDFVAILGYAGDDVTRILKVESFSEKHVHGIDLLRSSPTQPVHRSYLVEKVGRFAPVIGQQDD